MLNFSAYRIKLEVRKVHRSGFCLPFGSKNSNVTTPPPPLLPITTTNNNKNIFLLIYNNVYIKVQFQTN